MPPATENVLDDAAGAVRIDLHFQELCEAQNSIEERAQLMTHLQNSRFARF